MAYLTGQVLTQADIAGLIASAAFTPSLVQSGAVTKTVDEADYLVITAPNSEAQVVGGVKMTCTNIGTGNNSITVGLPVACNQSVNLAVGAGFWYDSSAGVTADFVLVLATTTTCVLADASQMNGSGIFLGKTGSVNANGLASGDIISYHFNYHTA